jgi:hypothetical protein
MGSSDAKQGTTCSNCGHPARLHGEGCTIRHCSCWFTEAIVRMRAEQAEAPVSAGERSVAASAGLR